MTSNAEPRRGRDGEPISPEYPIGSVLYAKRTDDSGLPPLPLRVRGFSYAAERGGWNYLFEVVDEPPKRAKKRAPKA